VGDGARASLARLDEITRRLRVECPWDREQDERSIVPHTVEEAYELADAAIDGDDEKLLDELGDVLFQVYFLSLLLEERGAGDLGAVAERMIEKLIRRHPHVFGEVEVDSNAGIEAPGPDADDAFARIGQRLFELVAEARELDVDPELALRTYARRFMEGAIEE
jgi:NTP pyrophosphatase (non-canonical NTP hydrolase)